MMNIDTIDILKNIKVASENEKKLYSNGSEAQRYSFVR